MAERRELIAEVADNLKKRGFEVHIAATPEEGKVTALALIPEGDSVCWGGSETVRELGIIEALRAAGKDTFVTSVNAVSRDGWLVNIDGTGNRVAATIYGPRNIVLVVGANKLVDGGLDDAIYRARNVAAPLNTKRLGRKTPCAVTGKCADCLAPDTICSQFVLTRYCKPAHRIKLVLIDSELGY